MTANPFTIPACRCTGPVRFGLREWLERGLPVTQVGVFSGRGPASADRRHGGAARWGSALNFSVTTVRRP